MNHQAKFIFVVSMGLLTCNLTYGSESAYVLSRPSSSPNSVSASPSPTVTPIPTPTPTPTAESPVPLLRESIVRQSSVPSSVPSSDNSVESFFMCGPTKQPGISPSLLGRVPRATPSSVATNKGAAYSMYRCVWHVLDNIGVPMFVGKDKDLDPSIDLTTGMPPIKIPVELRSGGNMAQGSAAANLTTRQGGDQSIPETADVHKIPESELEGVELPALKDATP